MSVKVRQIGSGEVAVIDDTAGDVVLLSPDAAKNWEARDKSFFAAARAAGDGAGESHMVFRNSLQFGES